MDKACEWFKEYGLKTIVAAVITIVTGLMVFGIYYSAIQPKEGVVVRKDYTPAYTSTDYRTVTKSDGTTMRIPMQEYHDARYTIVIRGIDKKGRERLGYYDVTPTEYENIKIGDYYVKQLE